MNGFLTKFKERFFPFRELPQNIIGYIVTRCWVNNKQVHFVILTQEELQEVYALELLLGIKLYVVTHESITKHWFWKWISGGSYGKYIALRDYHDNVTLAHERGHGIGSKKLGWLYIPVEGLPSVYNNLRGRIVYKKMTEKEAEWDYYNRYPEKQADKKGGVIWENGRRVYRPLYLKASQSSG